MIAQFANKSLLLAPVRIKFLTRKMHLLKSCSYINGEWVSASGGDTFEVKNPVNGNVITSVPNMGEKDTEKAITAASEAFKTWQFTTSKERSTLLKKWFDLLQKNKDSIAKILSCESGKPINEANGELAYGNGFIEWFAEQGIRSRGETIPSPVKTKRLFVERQPIGVASIITPWNFPLAMITRKVGAALAAGCTCVIKPAEDTPLTALAAVQLAEEAGIPKGVLNVITCDRNKTPEVGTLLCQSPLVAGVFFTGSTQTGKLLYKLCSDGIKRIGLELGGNAPFIVYNSANIDVAVNSAISSKFRNCGQTCVASNRFLIQEGVYDKFVDEITKEVCNLKIGDPSSTGTQIGPLINKAQHEKVSSFVSDAVSKGAKILTGGKSGTKFGELYYEPTVLVNITKDMRVYNEEVFGPVVSLIKFKDEEESLSIANNVPTGLAGYFFSQDLSQIFRVSNRLEVGMVGVNEGIISAVEVPFGGIKESGIGREGSHHGLEDYTYYKYICIGNLTNQ